MCDEGYSDRRQATQIMVLPSEIDALQVGNVAGEMEGHYLPGALSNNVARLIMAIVISVAINGAMRGQAAAGRAFAVSYAQSDHRIC